MRRARGIWVSCIAARAGRGVERGRKKEGREVLAASYPYTTYVPSSST